MQKTDQKSALDKVLLRIHILLCEEKQVSNGKLVSASGDFGVAPDEPSVEDALRRWVGFIKKGRLLISWREHRTSIGR